MSELKELNGIEEITAARDAGMEIVVDILGEWKPWNGEFGALLDQIWFKDLKFRARQRNPSNANTEAQTVENEVSEWHYLKGIEEVGAAVAEGMEIECKRAIGREFEAWVGADWFVGWEYRARAPRPAKELVKSICWRSKSGNLTWTAENYVFYSKDWKRFPAGDIKGDVEE